MLDQLPVELLNHIVRVGRLQRADVLALRATCTRLRQCTADLIAGLPLPPERGTTFDDLCMRSIYSEWAGRFVPAEVLAFASARLMVWSVQSAPVDALCSLLASLPQESLHNLGINLCPERAYEQDAAPHLWELLGQVALFSTVVHSRGTCFDHKFTMLDLALVRDVPYIDMRETRVLNVHACARAKAIRLRRCVGAYDISSLRHVRALYLPHNLDITDVSALGNVHTLDLHGCRSIEDVNALTNVHTLAVHECDNIKDMSALTNLRSLTVTIARPKVADVSSFCRLHTLHLEGNARGFSALKHLRSLKLYYASLTDVSMFSRIRDLELNHCHELVDVSPLGEVHALKLYYCPRVSNVSSLGRVHTLTLCFCDGITDVNALGRVQRLTLRECHGVSDVSALGNVPELNLISCRGVVDVSKLGGVRVLKLRSCANIKDVSALGKVHTLDLSGCTGIKDVSALGGVHKLNLSGCRDLTDVSKLGGVYDLDLSGCFQLKDVSALGNVRRLNLSRCMNIRDARALVYVPHLDLTGCPGGSFLAEVLRELSRGVLYSQFSRRYMME